MRYFAQASAVVALSPFLVSFSSASPIDTASTAIEVILKEGEPDVSSDWGSKDAERVQQSFQPTLEIVNSVFTAKPQDVDHILKKYFHEADKAVVTNVLKTVLRKDARSLAGAQTLSKITVWNKDHKKRCSPLLTAYLDDTNAENPQMEFCPAGLKHKTLSETQCQELGDHLSYKTMTISGELLAQYLQWTELTKAAAGGIITNQPGGFGPTGVRTLDKSKAKFNAYSYAYFASEVYFHTKCNKKFHRPHPGGVDDNDPACGGKVCQ